MAERVVHVRMFQFMELECNGHVIKNMDNRSQKLWLMLAYIIYFRKKEVSQDALLSAIWNDGRTDTGVLKTALHRVRAMLSEAYGEEFGKSFLCCKNKMYSVDEFYTLVLDVEEFDKYIAEARQTEDREVRFTLYKKAFELYEGDFLSAFSDVPWITPLNVYYHNLYMEIVCAMLEFYEKKGCYDEAIEILQKAGETARYEETLYMYLMRYQLHLERYKEVMNTYRYLRDMLEVNFDTKPSEEAKSLYYEAMYALSEKLLDIEELSVVVGQRDVNAKAMYCEFDFFKELYHAYCGGIARSEHDICLALITITDLQERFLSKRSLTCCVAHLKEILRNNLRSGDVVSMCTPCQFVLLLPNAKAADTEKAVERIKRAYFKKYSHSLVKLTSYVKAVGINEK